MLIGRAIGEIRPLLAYAETHCAIAGLVCDRAAQRAARHRPSTELVPAFPADRPGGLNYPRQDGSGSGPPVRRQLNGHPAERRAY